MLRKISFWEIVKDHIRTLYDYGSERSKPSPALSKTDTAVFFGAPALLTGVLVWRRVYIPEGQLGTLITAMSVFGALLFNLLILLYDVAGRAPSALSDQALKRRSELLHDIYANVAFSVLVTILAIVALVIAAVSPKDRVLQPTSAVVYYLLGIFALTLLMVLKRMHVLLRRDL